MSIHRSPEATRIESPATSPSPECNSYTFYGDRRSHDQASALPEQSHFDRHSAGEDTPNPEPANPQKSFLPIPNPIPQPSDCLWLTWERLGGSLGLSCTPFLVRSSNSHCSRSRYFQLESAQPSFSRYFNFYRHFKLQRSLSTGG